MQGLLVGLCMAILEKIIDKGSKAFVAYLLLREELAKNDKESQKYKSVVNDPTATREQRRKAEDDLLS